MVSVKVKRNFQVTIPSALRREFNIAEGDYIEVEGRNGEMVMRPVKLVHPDQEYFYRKEWEKEEAEADRDIAEGRVAGPFKSAKDLIKDLES